MDLSICIVAYYNYDSIKKASIVKSSATLYNQFLLVV